MNSVITSKIDWYTVILEGTTFRKILEKIHFPIVDYESLSLKCFSDYRGEAQWVYDLMCGINFRVPYDEINRYIHDSCDSDGNPPDTLDVMQHEFTKVRFDCTGSGLDFIRQYGFDLDYYFQDRSFWKDICADYHLTRCDFAFDFFNESKQFLNDFFSLLGNLIADGYRSGNNFGYNIKSDYSHRALKCSLKQSSSERTCYIGTTTSDKLLRIYDKYREAHKGDVWITNKIPWWIDIPPDDITDWCRFELQLRRDLCPVYLFDDLASLDDKTLLIPFGYRNPESMNFRHVLSHIFQYYLAYTDSDELNKLVRDFFDVNKLDQIQYRKPVRQNENLVQFGELNDSWIEKNVVNFLNTSCRGGDIGPFYKRAISKIFLNLFDKMVRGSETAERRLQHYERCLQTFSGYYGSSYFKSEFYVVRPYEYAGIDTPIFLFKECRIDTKYYSDEYQKSIRL